MQNHKLKFHSCCFFKFSNFCKISRAPAISLHSDNKFPSCLLAELQVPKFPFARKFPCKWKHWLINTYRPLKRISPLVWIDAGRPLDEKEISAVTLPVTIDHPASENMLETQPRKQGPPHPRRDGDPCKGWSRDLPDSGR